MASKKRLTKIANEGGYNFENKNPHIIRKREKMKQRDIDNPTKPCPVCDDPEIMPQSCHYCKDPVHLVSEDNLRQLLNMLLFRPDGIHHSAFSKLKHCFPNYDFSSIEILERDDKVRMPFYPGDNWS